MRHVDPDTLALLALGEDAASADDAAHLATCEECSMELGDLRRVVAAGRESTPEDIPTAPPAVVWERIQAELGLTATGVTPERGSAPPSAPTAAEQTAPTPEPPVVTRGPGPVEREHTEVEHEPPAVGTVSEVEQRDGEVVDLSSRRRRRGAGWLVAAAAVAGIAAGAVGGAWWASRPTAPDAARTILARAPLEPLPGWAATGVARVEEDDAGSRVVIVEVQGDLDTEGFREVWLLTPDVSGMVSLGLLDGSSGRFTVPEAIDLDLYSVVDVSEEPFDGDATHSGNSVVRGSLDI